jgi:hypothetical protein
MSDQCNCAAEQNTLLNKPEEETVFNMNHILLLLIIIFILYLLNKEC